MQELRPHKRLGVIIPYRDRKEHLKLLLPHLFKHLTLRAKVYGISFTFHIVEPSGTKPFNRGKVKNCGFKLSCLSSDYFCFHDVDMLPLVANYAPTSHAARLAWAGLSLQENYDHFFGGVVLFDKLTFEKVNGYPNIYWGWGPEDYELGQRCKLMGIDFEKRDGKYHLLYHPHNGFVSPGIHSEEAQATHLLFDKRADDLKSYIEKDGLTTLEMRLLARTPLKLEGVNLPGSYHYLIDI